MANAALSGFIAALRAAGAPVSTLEAIDAARAVAILGFDDRAALKAGLGSVLAKSEAERLTHDRLFELFFTREPSPDETPPEAAPAPPPQTETPSAPSPVDDGALARLLRLAQGGPAADLAVELAAAQAGAARIRFPGQVPYYTGRLLEALGAPALDRAVVAALEAGTAEGRAAAQPLMAAQGRLRAQARRLIERMMEVHGRAAADLFLEDAMAERPIAALSPDETPRLRSLVARLAKRLADRHGRRRRIAARGRLDVRRTLRASAPHGFVPFQLILRARRRDRPRLTVLCDVSASVSRHVRFLLLLLLALRERVADLRAFAFSARLGEVGPDLTQGDPERALQRILRVHGGGSTDYGQALADLFEHHADALDRRTTVLILGDARTNGADARLDLMRALAERTKRVVFLCPEPPGLWGTGDSVLPAYRPFCAAARHVATVSDLARAIDDILLAYG